MPALILDQTNRSEFLAASDDQWIVACLCAEWCDVCKEYQPAFHRLADSEPQVRFVWIDIEDHGDVVADLDVENFPTLLIQRGETVYFFGPVLPEIGIAERVVKSYQQQTEPGAAASSPQFQSWQEVCNLRKLLSAA